MHECRFINIIILKGIICEDITKKEHVMQINGGNKTFIFDEVYVRFLFSIKMNAFI
jgi:hypothetical protein